MAGLLVRKTVLYIPDDLLYGVYRIQITQIAMTDWPSLTIADLLRAAFALVLTLAALGVLERVASRLGLVDVPGRHKTHRYPTPVVGGIAMVIGVGVSSAALSLPFAPFGVIASIFCLFIIGVWDDCRPLPASARFALQAVALMPSILGGVLIESLGPLSGSGDVALGLFAVPITLFGVLSLVNGVNMIDGADGLAGSVGLVALAWFTGVALILGDTEMFSFGLAACAALMAFLAFNVRWPGQSRARVFMGDGGSVVLGFVLAWFAIELSQAPGGMPPVVALWVCAVPLLDGLAVLAHRSARRHSLMDAGNEHLHHLLARQPGFDPNAVVRTMAGGGLVLGAVGVIGWQAGVPDWALFVAALVLQVAVWLWRRALASRSEGLPRASGDTEYPQLQKAD